MSAPHPGRPAIEDDNKEPTSQPGDNSSSHHPGSGGDGSDAGQTTGAEQAAENRENDPPA